MKPASRTLTLAARSAVLLSVISISLALGACGKSPTDRIFTAGDEAGKAGSNIQLPDWPKYCTEHVPYAKLPLGSDPIALDKLDHGQIDLGNRKLDSCAEHYYEIQTGLAKATASH